MDKGTLYIVATPIGNLGDMTLRGLETLKMVDVILCEDTRVTSKLLAHFEISKPLVSYHHHSDEKKVQEIKEMLEQGKSIALVTDAGTPGISDPGNQLVSSLTTEQFDNGTISIVPIPGVSAVVTALSVSGFPTDKFLFLGFPPHKKGRKTFFEEVGKAEYTVVFYESSHRILKCLDELVAVLDNNRKVCVCRELTKKFETIYRGTIQEIQKMNISDKGEFVVIISN
jgi:16S rRNA (cytidine1402-2'-O)-methyltransferase